MGWDRIVPSGACVYDVDARGVRTPEHARDLLDATRARVARGRALRPDAAHYVTVTTDERGDGPVRDVLIRSLGQGDGVDSVAVDGPSDPAEPTVPPPPPLDLPAGWAALSRAAELDAPVTGVVVAVHEDGLDLEVDGVVGALARPPAGERVGDRLLVGIIAMNIGRRWVVFSDAPSAPGSGRA